MSYPAGHWKKMFSTPLGPMVGIGDKKALHVLAFQDSQFLKRHTEKFLHTYHPKQHHPLFVRGIQNQLHAYFNGQLKEFTVPMILEGTLFQKKAWHTLLTIPYGQTCCYEEQATLMDQKNSARAAANANARNPICILIPCHRVIEKSGKLAGYAAGKEKKQALLTIEKKGNKN